MKRRGTLAAAAIILLANAIVLLEVAYNRSGGPVETIRLTERELPVNFRENEDSGVSVRLQWRTYYPLIAHNYAWLDTAKLRSLGFDPDRALRDPKRPPLPRSAFIVLEYNGPAWERWLKSAQEAKPPLVGVETASHLVPIDAAATPDSLLRNYSDREKYLVVKGAVELNVQASVSQVLPETIHVPSPLSELIGRFADTRHAADANYTLTLAYGRDFEPWLVTETNGK